LHGQIIQTTHLTQQVPDTNALLVVHEGHIAMATKEKNGFRYNAKCA